MTPCVRHDASYSPDTHTDFALLDSLPAGPRRDDARRRVIDAWLPMAHRLARRFRDRGEGLDDLKQVAALGLVKAVDRYDPARAAAFESFAIPTIVGELKRHFRDNTWDVHVPRRVQELRNSVRTALREPATASEADERLPLTARLVARTGLCEDDVRLGLEALDSYRSYSLDAPFGHDQEADTLADHVGHDEPGFALVDDREAVRPFLADLSERERRILYLRFFRHMAQKAIGDELGISQMHVSRLLSRACARVRHQVSDALPAA